MVSGRYGRGRSREERIRDLDLFFWYVSPEVIRESFIIVLTQGKTNINEYSKCQELGDLTLLTKNMFTFWGPSGTLNSVRGHSFLLSLSKLIVIIIFKEE